MKASQLRNMASTILKRHKVASREHYIVFSKEESHRMAAENPDALIVYIRRFCDDSKTGS